MKSIKPPIAKLTLLLTTLLFTSCFQNTSENIEEIKLEPLFIAGGKSSNTQYYFHYVKVSGNVSNSSNYSSNFELTTAIRNYIDTCRLTPIHEVFLLTERNKVAFRSGEWNDDTLDGRFLKMSFYICSDGLKTSAISYFIDEKEVKIYFDINGGLLESRAGNSTLCPGETTYPYHKRKKMPNKA
jgi:hypothetical protein